MGATRRTTNLPAIDADSICDAALELTKQFGIDGWSIRQLAKAIKTHPVSYTHLDVYKRQASLSAAFSLVTNSVVAQVSPPAPIDFLSVGSLVSCSRRRGDKTSSAVTAEDVSNQERCV